MDLETFLQTLTETMHLKVQMVELTLSVFFIIWHFIIFPNKNDNPWLNIYIYMRKQKQSLCFHTDYSDL